MLTTGKMLKNFHEKKLFQGHMKIITSNETITMLASHDADEDLSLESQADVYQFLKNLYAGMNEYIIINTMIYKKFTQIGIF